MGGSGRARDRLGAGHAEGDPARVEPLLHFLIQTGCAWWEAELFQAGRPLLAGNRPRLKLSSGRSALRAHDDAFDHALLRQKRKHGGTDDTTSLDKNHRGCGGGLRHEVKIFYLNLPP